LIQTFRFSIFLFASLILSAPSSAEIDVETRVNIDCASSVAAWGYYNSRAGLGDAPHDKTQMLLTAFSDALTGTNVSGEEAIEALQIRLRQNFLAIERVLEGAASVDGTSPETPYSLESIWVTSDACLENPDLDWEKEK